MRVSRGADDATAPAGRTRPPLQAKSCIDAAGRRALEPRRQNRTRHQKPNAPSRQMHTASAFEQRRARATRIRSTLCLEAVQNGRVASRAHRRAAHHENTLAHRENKHAQSSNAYLHRTEAARRAGDAKHACMRRARCCRFEASEPLRGGSTVGFGLKKYVLHFQRLKFGILLLKIQ